MSSDRPRRRRARVTLPRLVKAALEQAQLRNDTLVVAVSGGPDSLALLYVLAELREALELRLHVAHLDHGLRPTSADDARFVAEESRKLGFPYTVEQADVAAHRRQNSLSLEQAAREVRYAFLARVATTVGASAVALGHTADDQAETVLLHLVRGGGLGGLRGMAMVSVHRPIEGPDITLVRPLLEVTRQETETYCRACGISPCQDETNMLTDIPRNYLRLEVLPRLARLNPRVREAIGRLAHAAALDLDYIEGQVSQLWTLVAQEVPGGLALDRQSVVAQHPAIQRHLLRRAYTCVVGNLEGLEQVHLEEMVRLLGGSAGRSLALPGGLRLEVQRGRAWITRGPAQTYQLPALEGEHPIPVPGETLLVQHGSGGEGLDAKEGGWRVKADLVSPPVSLNLGSYTAVLDYDALGGDLCVRSRRQGDRFQPLGVQGQERGKKLQDFLVNTGVPRSWRDQAPLVVSPRGVAWVVGWRIAHWVRVTPETQCVLRLEFLGAPNPGGSSNA